MQLEEITIKNFRMLNDVTLKIADTASQELTLIVGKNNTGKTSILKILEKMIPGSGAEGFEWHDFSMSYQCEMFEGIFHNGDENLIQQSYSIELKLKITYTDEDSYKIIRPFMLDLDEDNNTINLKCTWSMRGDKILELKNDLTELNNSDDFEFKDFSTYMAKKYKKYFTKIEYYAISQDGKFSVPIPTGHVRKLLKIRSIKANRDISNRAGEHGLSKISERLYHFIEDHDENQHLVFLNKIKETDESLTQSYAKVFEDVITKAEKFGASQHANIEVLSTIQERDLLKNNTTLFYSKDDVYLPESYNGLGYLNLIGMIFEIESIAKEYEQSNLEAKGLNLLFIEEPEAHTHPQLQYVFIKNIKSLLEEHREKNIQTLMTTHSSHIVSECDFEDVLYLIRDENYTVSKPFSDLKRIYDEESNGFNSFDFIKKHLKLTRAELFFADKAILIEGDTERILMRSMIELIDQSSTSNIMPLSSQNVSIVEVGAYGHIFKEFIHFLGIKTLIITDIDYGKDNGNGSIIKCDFDRATHTTNATICNFFSKQRDDFNEIKGFSFEEKARDNCRIAYQTSEDGLIKNYIGRSFEEAFINVNFEELNNLKNNFTSLKNKDEFTCNKTPLELADRCLDKKTTFATELLFYEDSNNKWKMPEYIKEGLEWLKEA